MEIYKLPLDDLPREQLEYLQKQKQEFRFVGKIKRVAGHTLFSFNIKTKEIKPARFENEVAIGLDGEVIRKAKCVIEADCIYDQALNKKNFIKRLRRAGLIE